MKTRSIYLILSACMAVLLTACEFDNYEGPRAMLQGRIVYNGEPIGVSYNDVNFQLWEPGWVKKTPIYVSVGQDGAFSRLLFDATYKLIIPSGQGPFRALKNDQTNSDTIMVQVKGDKTLDIEVLPFYMVRNAQFSASAGAVTASCSLEKIVTGVDEKNIERVSLYISKTYFADGRTSIATKDLAAADITDMNNISLQVNVPSITPAQNYVFARIGVKIGGVEDMLFSPVQKIML